MLTIERMYQPRDTKTDDEVLSNIESILNRINPEEIKEHGKVVTAMKNVWDWLGDVGQTTEMAGKLGGFKYLRENTDLAIEELGHRVRVRVGTPDFKRRGKWHRATNNLFVFSTIRKEGLRSAYEAYLDNPASFIWKVTMLSIIPKLIQIGLENADKFLPDNENAETIANIMQGIGTYKKENYLAIPLYMRSDDKSVAVTLPQDFTGQFLGNFIYDLAKLDFSGAAKATLEQSPYNPSNINPLAKLGWDAYNYISGNNVYDIWRGRNVISEENMALGGIDKFKDLASYEYGQLGGSTIVDPNIRYADSTVEKILNIFPFNALGRFIEISDYGFQEDINKLYELQRKASALVNKHKEQMRQTGRSSIDINIARKAYNDLAMYNRITRIFSSGRRRVQQIKLNDRLSQEEKRRKINEIERRMVNMARKALGKETLGE